VLLKILQGQLNTPLINLQQQKGPQIPNARKESSEVETLAATVPLIAHRFHGLCGERYHLQELLGADSSSSQLAMEPHVLRVRDCCVCKKKVLLGCC
jgi:hypothetical protein